MTSETKTKNLLDGVKSGMRIRIWQSIKEGDKERLQSFEGLVLSRKHGNEPGAAITVRGTLAGVGVEKIYPINAPSVNKVEILNQYKTRRSKLYFVRSLSAKKIKKKLRAK